MVDGLAQSPRFAEVDLPSRACFAVEATPSKQNKDALDLLTRAGRIVGASPAIQASSPKTSAAASSSSSEAASAILFVPESKYSTFETRFQTSACVIARLGAHLLRQAALQFHACCPTPASECPAQQPNVNAPSSN
jgi:hypothetical protein